MGGSVRLDATVAPSLPMNMFVTFRRVSEWMITVKSLTKNEETSIEVHSSRVRGPPLRFGDESALLSPISTQTQGVGRSSFHQRAYLTAGDHHTFSQKKSESTLCVASAWLSALTSHQQH